MNKLIIVLTLSFLLPLTTLAFKDVSKNSPNSDAIYYVQEKGIVDGYKDGSFRPNQKINRAEFTKIIIEATIDTNNIKGENCFPDVQAEWFAKYVCTAKDKRIIFGYPDETFHPEKSITFIEAAKIITNAFGYKLEEDEVIWYKNFANELSNQNAIPTTITSLKKEITRGEMTEIIWRIKKEIKNKDSMVLVNDNDLIYLDYCARVGEFLSNVENAGHQKCCADLFTLNTRNTWEEEKLICYNNKPICTNIGTRSEGWHFPEKIPAGGHIVYAPCPKDESEKPYVIRFKRGNFHPPEIDNLQLSDIYSDSKKHKLIQLKQLPTVEKRNILKNNGIDLLQYIDGNAYWASISTAEEINSTSEIQEIIDDIRWIGVLAAKYKISKSIDENNFSGETKYDDGTVRVNVSVFEDVSHEEAREALSSVNNKVQVLDWAYNNTAEVRLPIDIIEDIASIDQVEWIEQIESPNIPNS